MAFDIGVLSFSPREMWQMGFGGITSSTVLPRNYPGSAGLIFTIVLANTPQILLSSLLLGYNGLLTCMLLAQELSEYAHKRKPLRVTNRTGHQRWTYRLQIPYRYRIPLLIASGTLHWLLSQILFLARVDTFDSAGNISSANSFSSIGFSPIAIVTFLVLGSCLVILAYGTGFRTYKPGLPILGPCSAAISACSHRPVDDVNATDFPVKWGVVETEGPVGHCCFTSHEVLLPNTNRLYS